MVPAFFGLGLGLIAKGIGGLVGAFGRKKAAGAEASSYEAQAQAADVNRGFIQKRTAMELLLQGRQGIQAEGATRAAIGASGFTGGGSAGDILRQSARDIAFDAESIRVAGEAASEQERLKALGYRSAARGARTAGTIGAVGALLDTGADIFSNLPRRV